MNHFDIGPTLPKGFNITRILSEHKKCSLLKSIEQFNLQKIKFHKYEMKRKVMRFGHGWSLRSKKLKQGNAIPKEINFLVDKRRLIR